MAKAQEWLEENYPKEEREEIKKLNLSRDLEGSLKLEGFVKMEQFHCRDGKLTSLHISDCPQLTTIDCATCQITDIFINNCPEIRHLDIGDNLITEFNFKSLDPEKVTFLNIGSDGFTTPQDLSFLSDFTNLETLYIDTINKQKADRGFYNRLYGSLKPLKNMKKLKILNISNIDIDSGLEYLPESLETFLCNTNFRPEAGCQAIQKQLADYGGDYQSWRKANPSLIITRWKEEVQEEKEKIKRAFSILFPNQHYNFQSLQNEIKRLKIKELAPQVQKEKEQLKQLTNNLKSNLGSAGKYLLEKLLKKQERVLQNNDNESAKLKELKQTLNEELNNNQEILQTLLNKQVELHQLEKQLESLQQNQEAINCQEQQAQILQSSPWINNS
ncbi:hypothetical protein [endosymbiont GvMRE of Glomus versiforme]|uniref:hypothetical protein n=1 Tax=endosymbiont GvMRE of Glomus versiforme TaxID=2039283 RepID=UPI000ED21FDB|nr:hypothetical protein [endosymbiont GvMRE of Glomus versiforme]RHZ36051.1 Serine/threonine protein kinase [endosymbiont GvMRE of Glomus versiforme]